MTRKKKFWTVTALVYLTVNTIAALDMLRAERKKQAVAAELQKEFELDILAIERTAEVINQRSACGKYRWMHEIESDFQTELEFQKIAVRQED